MSFFASLTGGGSQTGLTNEEIATQISVLNDELNRSGACPSEEHTVRQSEGQLCAIWMRDASL